MRYSLLALFSAVTLLAAILAMVTQHGGIGIALLLPHLAAVVFAVYFARRRRRLVAALGVTIYLGAWAWTAVYGGRDVREHLRAEIVATPYAHLGPLPWKTLDYDAELDWSKPRVERPWLFVGNQASPCPLVVTVDYGVMAAPTLGEGGKAYFLWLFGYRRRITSHLLWLS